MSGADAQGDDAGRRSSESEAVADVGGYLLSGQASVLRVRHQHTRGDRSTPPCAARLKTRAGIRDVILLADLATLL